MSKERLQELVMEILHLVFAGDADENGEVRWNPDKELDSDTLGELVTLLSEFELYPPGELRLNEWP